MLLTVLLLQAASAPPPDNPTEAERFSILLPQCPKTNAQGDVVVCSGGPGSNRIPLPDDTGPATTGTPSNPNLTGAAALIASVTPCSASLKAGIRPDCQTPVGPPIVPIAKGVAAAARSVFAGQPDKTGRVPISLD